MCYYRVAVFAVVRIAARHGSLPSLPSTLSFRSSLFHLGYLLVLDQGQASLDLMHFLNSVVAVLRLIRLLVVEQC